MLFRYDYLQTLVEWGWLGSACWGVLGFGGMAVAWRNLQGQSLVRATKSKEASPVSSGDGRVEGWVPRQVGLIPLVLLGLGSSMLHAFVDFPLQIASIQLYVATYLGICWGTMGWARLAPEASWKKTDR